MAEWWKIWANGLPDTGKPENWPSRQDDQDLTKLDAQVKGEQTLPDVGRIDLQDFVQHE